MPIILIPILLIYIGLWLDNQKEDLQKRQEELNFLEEILVSLYENDSISHTYIYNLKIANDGQKELIEHLESKKKNSTELNKLFAILGNNYTSEITKAAYENLKNQGLERITNPILRIEISKFYDDYFRLIRDQENKVANFTPIFQELNFKYFKSPIDSISTFKRAIDNSRYQLILQDFKYHSTLRFDYNLNLSLQEYHREALKKNSSLRQKVKREIQIKRDSSNLSSCFSKTVMFLPDI